MAEQERWFSTYDSGRRCEGGWEQSRHRMAWMRECDERMGGPGHGGCGGRKGGKGFRRLEEEVTSWEQKRLGLGERKNLKRKSDAKVPKAGGEGGCEQEKNF